MIPILHVLGYQQLFSSLLYIHPLLLIHFCSNVIKLRTDLQFEYRYHIQVDKHPELRKIVHVLHCSDIGLSCRIVQISRPTNSPPDSSAFVTYMQLCFILDWHSNVNLKEYTQDTYMYLVQSVSIYSASMHRYQQYTRFKTHKRRFNLRYLGFRK